MATQLSQGVVRRVHSSSNQEQLNDGAVVQVLEVKKIEPKPGQTGDRYRLVISDGDHYIQAMLATQLNHLVAPQGPLQASSILRLNEYIANEINARKVIIMLNVTVVQEKADNIGNPTNIMAQANAGVPAPFGGVKAEQKRAQPTFMSKGGAGAGAAAAASSGMQHVAPNMSFHPIASLHPYHTRWTIKARVTAKSEKRTWTNAKGEGALFSVDLLDAQGGQIKATMFREEALEKFYDVFQENHVYIISKGQLKPANKKFSRLPNEYELTLNSDAEVIPVDEDTSIDLNKFDFVPIEAIQKIEPNEFVDIIGVVVGVAPLTELQSKAGAQLKKRAITLVDKTLCQVEVTLWGDQAERYNESMMPPGTIVAVKSCKVSDFGGRSLSSSFQSQIFVNPDHPNSHELRGWWDANGSTLTDLQNISKQARGEGAGAGAAGNARKTLSDIKDEQLGMKDKPDFFSVRATVTFFKHDWDKGSLPWYMACPQPNCNKKVTEESGSWHCEKCARSYPAPSPRFILSLMVCDSTGSTWLTAFNDAAQMLLGGTTAEQLHQLVQTDQKDQASAYFKASNFKEYVFKVRAKAEMGNDQEQRVRAHILSATPVNYIQECNSLLAEIARYD